MIRLLICFTLLAAPFFAGCADPVGLVGRVFFSPVSIATTAYSLSSDERSFATQADDATIRTVIRAQLQVQAPIEGFSVSIYSYDGHVFLMGNVSPDTRWIATDIARRTSGVRRVVTHWFPQESGDLAGDLSIGSLLRANMITDIYLSSTQIDTFTCDGNVLLLGVVRSPDDERRALEVAKTVSGVRSVKSYLLF